MRRIAILAAFLGILLVVPVASAATISVDVVTDKATYAPGETVLWTIYAWASTGNNFGVSLLSVDLTDNKGESLTAALTVGGGPTFELKDTQYGVDEWFTLEGKGTPNGVGGIEDIVVKQSPSFPLYNIGNGGGQYLYAEGSYTATVLGLHTLTASVRAANYWPNTTGSLPVAFETKVSGDTQFNVTPEPATLILLGLGGVALLRRRR